MLDTGAWFEPESNIYAPGDEYAMNGRRYEVGARSVTVFIAQ